MKAHKFLEEHSAPPATNEDSLDNIAYILKHVGSNFADQLARGERDKALESAQTLLTIAQQAVEKLQQ